MKFFKNLFREKKSGALFLCVECDNCGEEIKIRINPATDINDYVLKKEILGNNCNTLIYAEIHYDSRYEIISSKVIGGKLVSVSR